MAELHNVTPDQLPPPVRAEYDNIVSKPLYAPGNSTPVGVWGPPYYMAGMDIPNVMYAIDMYYAMGTAKIVWNKMPNPDMMLVGGVANMDAINSLTASHPVGKMSVGAVA